MDLALQRAAPKTTSHSSSQEAIAPGTSSEPAQHHQASASGNSRPLSQHSVGSHTHTARTEEGVVEVAHEGPNEGEGGVLEELVEEVVEVEGTKGDMENVSARSHIAASHEAMLCLFVYTGPSVQLHCTNTTYKHPSRRRPHSRDSRGPHSRDSRGPHSRVSRGRRSKLTPHS